MFICHQIPDDNNVQKQAPMVFSRPVTLLKRDSSTGVFLNIAKILRTPISKNFINGCF